MCAGPHLVNLAHSPFIRHGPILFGKNLSDDRVQLCSASQGRARCSLRTSQLARLPCRRFQGSEAVDHHSRDDRKQRVSVCEAIGGPELGADARFARARDRVQRRDEIIQMIEHWLVVLILGSPEGVRRE
jgi:hypothetical protein